MQFNFSILDKNAKVFKELETYTENYVGSTREYFSRLAQNFKGVRAVAMFDEWNSIQAELEKSIRTLKAANEFLERVSREMHSIDGPNG